MSTDRDTTRIVRSWLRTDEHESADRVLGSVLDQLDTTPQRPATSWPARRIFQMNKTVALAAAAATAVILAIVGFGFLAPPGAVRIGDGPGTPTATPEPSATALPASGTDLAPGRYAIENRFPFHPTFDVPDGWFACSPGMDEIGVCTDVAADENSVMGINLMIVTNVVSDPCDAGMPHLAPRVGPSVDDLVTAIADLEGFTATEPEDITVGGFAGRQFELTAPQGDGGCVDDGDDGFGTWKTRTRTNGVGQGEVNLLRILDVDGVRLVAAAAYDATQASAEEVAEFRRVFDSMDITP